MICHRCSVLKNKLSDTLLSEIALRRIAPSRHSPHEAVATISDKLMRRSIKRMVSNVVSHNGELQAGYM